MKRLNLPAFSRTTVARVRPGTAAHAVHFCVVSRSAADASIRGGDVFEIVAHADGSTSILVADISSKGPTSVAHAEILRRTFQRATQDTTRPSRVLAALDALRFEAFPRALGVIFTTAFVAHIARSQESLVYASAGHIPALLVAGGTHQHLSMTGPLLGVLTNARHHECRKGLERDALLVIATDGFSECANAALDSMQFGTSGIIRALAFDKIRSSRSAAEVIARSADVFTGGHYHDDATIAVITRRS